jgi:CRISPR/Cas system-associated exonuclease Cas4 (RecB family)
MLFFSHATLKYGPWSPSKLGVLLDCPVKFNLDSSKFKVAKSHEFTPDTTALDIGVSAHKYAEILISSPTVSKEAAALSSESGIPLTEDSKEKLVRIREGIDNFSPRIAILKSHGETIFDKAELKAAVDRDLRPVDFFSKDVVLRGKIDRAIMISKNGAKHIIAIDYKTGKYKEEDSKYSLQLETYGVLLHSMYPDAISVQPYLYYAEEEKLVGHNRRITKNDITSSNVVFTELNKAAEDYAANQPPEKKIGGHCNWCKYKLHCQSS